MTLPAGQRTANCACGAASVTVTGAPKFHAVCHCTNCKRRTGSAFGVSAYYPREALVGTAGAMTVYAFHNATRGHDQRRFFCAACGTTLYWYDEALPLLLGVAAGCFGEDPPGAPTVSFTHAKKCAWVTLPEAWRAIDD